MSIKNTAQFVTKLLMHSIHNIGWRTRICCSGGMNGITNHIQQLLSKGYWQAPNSVKNYDTRSDPRRQSIQQRYIPSMKHFGGSKTVDGNHGDSMLLRQLEKAFANNGVFLIWFRAALGITFKDFRNSTRNNTDAVPMGQRFVDRRSRRITEITQIQKQKIRNIRKKYQRYMTEILTFCRPKVENRLPPGESLSP